MTEPETPPTLYDWAGGMPALERLTAHFYDRVKVDPVLEPVFAQMHGEHPRFVAQFIARLAVLNSQPGAEVVEDAPMPKWGWGVPGGPYQG